MTYVKSSKGGKMTDFRYAEDVTAEVIGEIVDDFSFEDEEIRKLCIDAINDRIMPVTDVDHLREIARRYAD